MSETKTFNRWMVARWSAAVTLLAIPAVAMQFSDQVVWGPEDFIVAAVLLFGSLTAYEFVSRMNVDAAYRTGLAVGIGALFLLLWVNGAVGITDGSADAAYLLVVAVAAVGALVARFRPGGMAMAMWSAAIAMTVVGVVALAAGLVPEFNSAFEVLGITAFFVLLFGGSAVLFREADKAASHDRSAR
ncbi:MAG: hypothetical protein HKN17_07830 [Rhodothermales bacterium]|nr:hypothetical protein [Rhodothermales bacterium]